MIAQERLKKLVNLVERGRKVSVHDLQKALRVSPATLRRDLAELESLGKIVRVRGGVVHPGYFRGEASLSQRMRRAAGIKRTMAQAAAELLPARSTVWLDAGTTCLELGRLLLSRRGTTILTHSLPLAMRACEVEDGAKVVMVGGEVRAVSGATVGALALSWAGRLRADWCFLGASGLSESDGASTTEIGEAAVKEAILHRSRQRVLLADMSKWNKPATVNFAAWNQFDFWISSGELDESTRRRISAAGPRVIWA